MLTSVLWCSRTAILSGWYTVHTHRADGATRLPNLELSNSHEHNTRSGRKASTLNKWAFVSCSYVRQLRCQDSPEACWSCHRRWPPISASLILKVSVPGGCQLYCALLSESYLKRQNMLILSFRASRTDVEGKARDGWQSECHVGRDSGGESPADCAPQRADRPDSSCPERREMVATVSASYR